MSWKPTMDRLNPYLVFPGFGNESIPQKPYFVTKLNTTHVQVSDS